MAVLETWQVPVDEGDVRPGGDHLLEEPVGCCAAGHEHNTGLILEQESNRGMNVRIVIGEQDTHSCD